MRGTVLFFNHTYGFIRTTELEEDIFFHFKDIESQGEYKELFPGDCVEFEIIPNDEKTRACNVRVIDETVAGIGLVKAHVFDISEGEFELRDFYEGVISKIPMGLRYVTVLGDKMITTSKKLELDELIGIVTAKNNSNNCINLNNKYTVKIV